MIHGTKIDVLKIWKCYNYKCNLLYFHVTFHISTLSFHTSCMSHCAIPIGYKYSDLSQILIFFLIFETSLQEDKYFLGRKKYYFLKTFLPFSSYWLYDLYSKFI